MITYQKLEVVLPHVLSIIDYSKDKKQFTNEFLQSCRQYTVLAIIAKLPDKTQKELRERLAQTIDPQEGKAILLSFVSQDLYTLTLDSVSERVFSEYIDELIPTLSLEKKEKLEIFLRENNL